MNENVVLVRDFLFDKEEVSGSYKVDTLDNIIKFLPHSEGPIILITSPIELPLERISNINKEFINEELILFHAALNHMIKLDFPLIIIGRGKTLLGYLKGLRKQYKQERFLNQIKRVYKKVKPFLPHFLKMHLKKVYLKKQSLSNHQLDNNMNVQNLPSDILKFIFCDNVEKFYPSPKSIQLIISNKCNLSCIMCPYHSPQFRPYFKTDYFKELYVMKFELFKKIAEECGRLNIQLRMGNIEEPLLHKDIIRFCSYAKKVNVSSIHISTNGCLLTTDKIKDLVESGVDDWQISINAARESSYRKICRDKFKLSEVTNNVRNLIKENSRLKKGTIRVSIIKSQVTDEEVEEFIDFWRNEGVDQVTVYALCDYEMGTDKDKTESFIDVDYKERLPCVSPWTEMYILPEGEIGVCCNTITYLSKVPLKDLSLGRIGEEGVALQDIWTGEDFQNLRRSLIDNKNFTYLPCHNCRLWAFFKTKIEMLNDRVIQTSPWMKVISFNL